MSANSDVKLTHGAVVIDAWDLQLDSPDRRQNNSEHRRALVHDFDDGLTVNWGNDYPGGVTMNGVKRLRAFQATPQFGGGPFQFGRAIVLEADTVMFDDVKIILGFPRIVGDLKVSGTIELAQNGDESIDLSHEITNLRNEIAQLKDRVAKLENQ